MRALRQFFVWVALVSIVIVSFPQIIFAQAEPTTIIDAVFNDLSQKVGRTVTRTNADAWAWEENVYPDASLGCPQAGQAYAQVQTRGYRIAITFAGVAYDYRAAKNTNVIFQCNAGASAPVGPATTAIPPTAVAPMVVIGGSQPADPVSYQNPLVYVGADGNVYVASAGQFPGTAITNDGSDTPTGSAISTRQYAQFRWSPDFTKLIFTEFSTRGLYMVVSGQKPTRIASGLSVYFPGTWTPAGNEVAYPVDTTQMRGDTGLVEQVQAVPVTGNLVGAPHVAGEFVQGIGCGGGGADPAEFMYMNETGYGGNPFTLVAVPQGFVATARCTDDRLTLTAPNGEVLWTVEGLSRTTVSPDRTKAVAMRREPGNPLAATTELVLIDLATGATTPIQSEANPDQIAWSPDGASLIYSTLKLTQTLAGSQFEGRSYSVTLWRMPAVGGPSIQLFQQEGRGIGVIAPAPDNSSVAVSFITSSLPMVQQMNAGATGDQIKNFQPLVNLYIIPFNGGSFQNAGLGKRPSFGKGSFSAVPATSTVQNTGVTDGSTAQLPNLLVNGQAVVTQAGNNLNIRESPTRSAPILKTLKEGTVVTVTAGPVATDGFRWWRVRADDGTQGWVVDQITANGVTENMIAPR